MTNHTIIVSNHTLWNLLNWVLKSFYNILLLLYNSLNFKAMNTGIIIIIIIIQLYRDKKSSCEKMQKKHN